MRMIVAGLRGYEASKRKGTKLCPGEEESEISEKERLRKDQERKKKITNNDKIKREGRDLGPDHRV